MGEVLQAPFVWFGGKRKVAAEVWDALGDVDNYIEPFAGSLAVLLGRPARHRRRCETVNDADSYLSNFWRAIAADPEAVAAHADWPVNETDLFCPAPVAREHGPGAAAPSWKPTRSSMTRRWRAGGCGA